MRAAPRGDVPSMRWSSILASAIALGSVLVGCGAAAVTSAPPLRHAERVDAVVIRTLTTQPGVELDAPALAEVRAAAVRRVAEAVDDLPAAVVDDLRLDIDLAELGPSGGGARARCLITVSTMGPPERTRSMLQGAAAVTAHERPRVAAANGAVRAALRRLPQALSAL